jgi:hypothetical protein
LEKQRYNFNYSPQCNEIIFERPTCLRGMISSEAGWSLYYFGAAKTKT